MDEAITVQRGEPVELRLPVAMQWVMNVRDPAHILTPIAPQGEADDAGQSLIWRFATLAVGAATVLFSGRPNTAPGFARSHLVMAREFTIIVQ